MRTGEFALIENIKSAFKGFNSQADILGIGDDCAVLPQDASMEMLVSTDMLVEGSHFLLEDISPYELGWKSAAVNISDIAAMGGSPIASFLSFALPSSLTDEFVKEFVEGYKDISVKFACPLLGGDTCLSPDRLCINVAVLGQCAKNESRKRSMAMPGDLICVSSYLGDSAAGLDIILNKARTGADYEPSLINAHYRPYPRVELGQKLRSFVNAMMDISDGLASDLRHIVRASGVNAEIDCDAIPVSDSLKSYCLANDKDPLKFALEGGEDYELLFTVSPENYQKLIDNHVNDTESGHPSHICCIGRITEQSSDADIVWKGLSRVPEGFTHF